MIFLTVSTLQDPFPSFRVPRRDPLVTWIIINKIILIYLKKLIIIF